MKVNVVMFARVRELTGSDHLQLDLDADATIQQFKRLFLERFPQLEELLPHCSVSLNREYASDSTILTEDCEVGLIPPVSGG